LLTAVMMAGYTAEYVNSVLAKVAAGDNSGGLSVDEWALHFTDCWTVLWCDIYCQLNGDLSSVIRLHAVECLY